ncbi:hypothetical protein LF887_10825 [Chryseobacterium sp. MEBOG06]|uniref:hypothetical protein n=1 Tax=Chryseobacterium sp. MEBOG06 TaxID=2879938 RepID=UPI001F31CFBB|nr:hypothetical protein [Chryseobacterium sp. MEBOG06]UKB86090.1 hypothetical protein LF887_10825 [Chryseobacterium sp. MEBOG06]
MRKIILPLMLFILNSCATHIDTGNNINSNKLDFIYLKDYNEFIYKSKVNASADNQTYITTNFSERLPKGVLAWKVKGNEFYFNYKHGQTIYINSGYKNIGNSNNWSIKDVNKEDILNVIKDSENQKQIGFEIKKNRVTKIYSDGRVSILLLNIKQDKINEFLNLIQNFEYLN